MLTAHPQKPECGAWASERESLARLRERCPPIRKNDRAGRHRRSEFRECLPAVGKVLFGMRMSIGNAAVAIPGLSEYLRRTASKLRLHGHGFAATRPKKFRESLPPCIVS